MIKIVEELKRKHPSAEPCDENIVIPEMNNVVQPVIFERIDSDTITRCAKNIHGSGGPSRIDAETWRNMICSKAHGEEGAQLSVEIANLARRLCSEEIPYEFISSLMSCRLVPLKKVDNSVRPVGIGETLRRIISQWRNFAGLAMMAPPGSKKSPPSGAPGHRACWGQYVKIRPKNLNK